MFYVVHILVARFCTICVVKQYFTYPLLAAPYPLLLFPLKRVRVEGSGRLTKVVKR